MKPTWSDCQIVPVEVEGGDVDAVTLLEALMRLPSEKGPGRPELAEEPVPEFEPQMEPPPKQD